ncbi:MAG TPA: hypothetical protein VMV92_01655 [Streptosporangiaceae bacterium]|nr:hypothetical protein [Streptosporangiaceae bacterium]
MAALAVLAAGAVVVVVVVSWDAQYVMVRSARHVALVAALEAGIPDAGALIFVALGIALALHGRRALRPRTLNVACVAISLSMNAMAAGPGGPPPGSRQKPASGAAPPSPASPPPRHNRAGKTRAAASPLPHQPDTVTTALRRALTQARKAPQGQRHIKHKIISGQAALPAKMSDPNVNMDPGET